MRKTIVSLLLIAALTLTMLPAARAAQNVTEVDSATALCEALAPTAGVLRVGRTAEPARILLLADTLTDAHGARRAVHWAAGAQYVLEYTTRTEAEDALAALRAEYGADRCWLDTPDLGATVLAPEDGTGTAEPEPSAEPTQAPATEPPESPLPEPSAEPTATPEPTQAPSWGASALGLDTFAENESVRKHTAGSKVTVAVLDTGAVLSAAALRGREISPYSYDFVNATSRITDVASGSAAGHGTMIASLLSSLLPQNAELMILRVFDDKGSATRAMIRTAILYALEHDADILNMSLGWEGADSSYTFLDSVLDQAYLQGVPVVCAAGNSGANVTTCYPASYRTTIAVSAIGKNGSYELFSNYGDGVDFCAPGSNIPAAGPDNVVKLQRGTSFAAPHITAAAADVLLLCPGETPQSLYADLKACSLDLGTTGRDALYGWGLPQMALFVDAHLTHTWDAGHVDPLATRGHDGEKVFRCEVCGETKTETIPATAGRTDDTFHDVSAESWYAEAVHWASVNAVTAGYGSETQFAPNASCTRAQMVTFLWRAAGCPAPETDKSPFADVQNESDYFYRPVLWAVENGITSGTDETHFSPGSTVTRAQTVTFLWRTAGRPTAKGAVPFADTPANAYYYDAVRWAVHGEITKGTDETHFSPDSPCTRAQIVTFLYRDLGL